MKYDVSANYRSTPRRRDLVVIREADDSLLPNVKVDGSTPGSGHEALPWPAEPLRFVHDR